ncbi:MAG: isopenicillin-N N-acyltransferase-like protein [Candidatus Azotimanducaceae bacterium]|jgi:isopenicillin-N N-acyltransferase-like protein
MAIELGERHYMTVFLKLKGAPREIGYAHGQALAEKIAACIAIYRDIFGLTESALGEAALAYKKLIWQYAPKLAEEIEGIAAGSGQPQEWIYALNARSELMSTDVPECTSVYFPETGIIGQTWDWLDFFEDLYVVLSIEQENGHKLLTVTEPGIVGKVGLSSSGIGVCLNFLSSPGLLKGLPIHIVLRKILEARSLNDAKTFALDAGNMPGGKSGNVLVGSAMTSGFNIEYTAVKHDLKNIGSGGFSHTNHCVFSDIDPGLLGDNSRARLDRANYLISHSKSCSTDDLKTILSDTADTDNKICADYVNFGGIKVGTVSTIVMDLKEGVMEVRKGSSPTGEFQCYRLSE